VSFWLLLVLPNSFAGHICLHVDPMNEGMRISDEAIGAAIGGLFLLGVALVTVLAAVKYIKSWRKKRKLLKGCNNWR